MFSLESAIPEDSFVRVVNAFVDVIDLESFGFAHVRCEEQGRPPYHPAVLLKLYLYGYRYGIRSSRKLEREARTNIEAMWLLSGLRPKYKTIADFRKDNSKAFREIFRRFVCLLKEWDLVDGETLAIDSFKIRGSNSIKNNFNEAKLKRNIEYIDKQISEYEQLLDSNDDEENRKEIKKKLTERQRKKSEYEEIRADLAKSGQEQISLTDPDSRSVVLHRNIVNVGYNIQAASDSKHKLLVEYDTGDVNDSQALGTIAIKSKDLLNIDSMTVLADKGYHTGKQLEKCNSNDITTYVSPKAPATKDTGLYPVSSFTYDYDNDHYICPRGSILRTNGRWHKHSDSNRKKKAAYRFRRYTTADCRNCKSRHLCTASKSNGRYIDRSEYADVIEANAQRVRNDPEYYRMRQQITEYMFGTMKRQQGFTYTLVRTKENVLGEVGLMFTGYNLCRCISVLGVEKLIRLLREHCLLLISGLRRLNCPVLRDYFPICQNIQVYYIPEFIALNQLIINNNW